MNIGQPFCHTPGVHCCGERQKCLHPLQSLPRLCLVASSAACLHPACFQLMFFTALLYHQTVPGVGDTMVVAWLCKHEFCAELLLPALNSSDAKGSCTTDQMLPLPLQYQLAVC